MSGCMKNYWMMLVLRIDALKIILKLANLLVAPSAFQTSLAYLPKQLGAVADPTEERESLRSHGTFPFSIRSASTRSVRRAEGCICMDSNLPRHVILQKFNDPSFRESSIFCLRCLEQHCGKLFEDRRFTPVSRSLCRVNHPQ